MVEQSARSLGGAVPDTRAGGDVEKGTGRWLVAVDDAQRLLDRVEDLHGADDDAAVGVAAHRALARVAESGFTGGLDGGGGQSAPADRVAGERPGQVPASVETWRAVRWSTAPGARRRDRGTRRRGKRAGGQRLFGVGGQPVRGGGVHDRRGAALDGVGVRGRQGQQVVVASGVGEVEPGHPAHGLRRRPPSPGAAAPRAAAAPATAGTRWNPPSRALTGWIARPPSDLDQAVARLLQPQPALDVRPRGCRPGRTDCRSRGSRGRAAGGCAASGSRSTHRSTSAGAVPPAARRRRHRRRPPGPGRHSSGTRRGRCRTPVR